MAYSRPIQSVGLKYIFHVTAEKKVISYATVGIVKTLSKLRWTYFIWVIHYIS